MKRRLALALSCLILVCGFVVIEGSANRVMISGSGSGAFENPPISSGGIAWASCYVDRTLHVIDCGSSVLNIVDLRSGHLHLGGPGVNGPVAIPIPDLPVGVSGAFGQNFTLSTDNMIPLPAHGIRNAYELLHACAAGNCYLNYHTLGGCPVRC